ncbi:MAG: polysaccharide pyruvyl transferase family protein [Pseudomonadota bacterium]
MMLGTSKARRIIIYGAVSSARPKTGLLPTLKSHIKTLLVGGRDTLLWRLGSSRHFDYRNYLTASVFNRGDEAITAATRKQLLHIDPDIEFIDVDWGNLDAAVRKETVRGIDLIVIAGSGYIALDGQGKLSDRINQDLQALSNTDAPMVLYGVGVNQLLESRMAGEELTLNPASVPSLRSILARASLTGVRDQATQDLLKQFSDKPVTLTGDPALYFSEVQAIANDGKPGAKAQPVVGINFALHGPMANARFKRNLRAYVEALKRLQLLSGCRFVYFVHFGTELIIPRLLAASGIRTEIVCGNPDTLAQGYSKLSLHIGEMLHSNILAMSSGTPTIALAYDIKHIGFFKLLNIEHNCFSSVEFAPDLIINMALEILKTEATIRERIRERREVLEKGANQFIESCALLTSDADPVKVKYS